MASSLPRQRNPGQSDNAFATEPSISRWEPIDSLFIFLGAALLSTSFFIAILNEAMRG